MTGLVKEHVESEITFDNWQKRLISGEALKFDVKCVHAEFQVEFRATSSDDKENLSLYVYRRGVIVSPIDVKTFRITSGGGAMNASFEGVTYLPPWILAPSAPKLVVKVTSGYGWATLGCKQQVFEEATKHGDTLTFKATLDLEIPSWPWMMTCASCLGVSKDAETLLSMLQETKSVTLVADNDFEMQIPKALLCTQSEALRAALESSMEEGTSNTVRMADVSEEGLKDFALCLLTGGVNPSVLTSWKRISRLATVADKYAVKALADSCASFLSVATTKNNIAALLNFVDQRPVFIELRRSLIRFALAEKDNIDIVMNSDEYATFSADLLRDLLAFSPPSPQPDRAKTFLHPKYPILARKEFEVNVHRVWKVCRPTSCAWLAWNAAWQVRARLLSWSHGFHSPAQVKSQMQVFKRSQMPSASEPRSDAHPLLAIRLSQSCSNFLRIVPTPTQGWAMSLTQ